MLSQRGQGRMGAQVCSRPSGLPVVVTGAVVAAEAGAEQKWLWFSSPEPQEQRQRREGVEWVGKLSLVDILGQPQLSRDCCL